VSVLADISCGPGLHCSSIVGYLTVIMAAAIFIGSVFVVLSAAFGPRMGYLVMATALFGWLIILSSLWAFGFWSQGLSTPTNLGPRGTEPHWQAVGAGLDLKSPTYPIVARYPGRPWEAPTDSDDPRTASVGTVTTAVQDFMAARANAALAKAGNHAAVLPTDFTVTDVEFTSVGKTSLSAAHAFFNNGGPTVTVFAYHDSGNVPIYSYAFLGASIVLFLVHVPFLDKAERKRKAVLTGGKQPEWRGPA